MKANTKKAKLLSLVLAILTALSTVTVLPFSVFAEDAVTSLTITPNYGKIENYGTPKQTFFILTMRSAKGDDDSQALYNKVRDWQATMNMTITDTTDGSVQTIKNYHVLNPGLEFVTYTYIRLSASRYGVELNPSHAYTLKIDVLENGKVTYSGTSASGAFLSTQDDFKTNGTIAHRTYTADTQSPMYGKNALFIGDSITEAICEIKIPTYGVTAGWPGRVSAQNGMNYINAGVSGWSISNIKSQIYKQLQSNLGRPVDYILVGGGANDAWFNAPIGNVTPAGTASSAFDQSTFAGGLEYLFSYAKENFPNAKIGYVMNFKVLGHWYGDTNILGYLDDMTELFNTARKICEKWNVPYLDLYNNDVVSERMQYTTTYAMADYIHPNDKGYDILSPYIDQFMRAVATGKTQAEINALPDPAYDGPAAVITESDVDVAFGKSAVNKDGASFPTATDGDWKSAKVFGTRNNDPKVSIENQPYLEIDLGWYYDLDKVRVSNYGPNMNLLYQYVIYATDDNTKPLSKWTVLGENKCNIASGEGLIYSFAPTTARYLRLYATGTYGESTYYISSFQAFGKLNPNDPTTDKTPVKVSADKSAVTWDNQSTFKLTDGDKTEEAYATSVGKKSFTVLDLGSVKSVSNVKVLTYEGDSSYGIYGSADGSTWTPIGVKTVESGVSAYETKAGGEYRYIKLLGLRSRVGIGDGYIVIRQIYVQDADENTIQPVSYTEENIAIGGWTTKNALDGNENDGNYLALGDPVSYITLDLGQVRNLRSVVLFPEDAALPLNVSVSADGETFQSYGKYTGKETYDAAEGYMMAGIASARYIRITPDLSTAPESFGLYEIEASAILEDGDDGTTYNTLVSDKATETTSTGGSSSLLSDGDKTEKSLTIAYTPNGYVMLDLGSSQQISKVIAYTPADDKNSYEILGSNDQKNWTSLGIKELSGDKSYEAAVNAEYPVHQAPPSGRKIQRRQVCRRRRAGGIRSRRCDQSCAFRHGDCV